MMKRAFVMLILVLLMLPFVAAYGVTFYNPAWNPQDGMVFDTIEADTPYVFNVKNPDIAMTSITFTIDRDADNAGLTVYNLKTVPSDLPAVPENSSYEVNELKYSGFVPHDTKEFVYKFKVAKGWLENNSVPRNTVSLHAYDRVLEVWEILPTNVAGDDESFVFYSAEGTGVHYLFIGKSDFDVPEGMISEPEEVVVQTPPATPAVPPSVPPAPVPEPTSAQMIDEDKEVVTTEEVGISSEVTPVQLDRPAPVQPSAPAPVSQPAPRSAPSSSDGDGNGLSKFSIVLLSTLLGIVLVVTLYFVLSKRPLSNVDRELHNYINESLKRGKTKEEVRKRLLEVGWHPDRVDRALARHREELKPVESESDIPTENLSMEEAKALAALELEELRKRRAKTAHRHVKAKKK